MHALIVLCVSLLLVGCKAKAKQQESEQPAAGVASPSPTPKQKRGNKGVLDVTFFVASDTHFGFGVDKNAPDDRDPVKDPQGLEVWHKEVIQQMNTFERDRDTNGVWRLGWSRNRRAFRRSSSGA